MVDWLHLNQPAAGGPQRTSVVSGRRGRAGWVAVALILGVFLPGVIGAEVTGATRWRQWEATLRPHLPAPRAYFDVEVDVDFRGPERAAFTVPAFWEGERGWVVRAAFPATGRWEWESRCSVPGDAGLHRQRGVVEVAEYAGANPLWKHGDLRVSGNRRHLVHADGTPFLWIGDTAWNGPRRATAAEWREYVAVRADQRFSVLQVIATGLGPKFGPVTGPAPFQRDQAPNPYFWADLDARLAEANERGLVVFLTGLGRSYAGFGDSQRSRAFSRYVAGRFAAHAVVFSTSMDQRYDLLNDETGARLRSLTTHLVAQHPGTNFEAARIYRDSGYTDFCGLQTGHHGGNLPRVYAAARTWTLQLWQREPAKPVVNLEAMYDALGGDHGPAWREQDARRLGWLSLLSGACGYTYGAGDVPPKVPGGGGGIWRFDSNPGAYDHWRKALHWPSAAQVTRLRDFFAGLAWWTLRPAPEVIRGQPEDPLRQMAAARSESGDLLVAYLPDNPEVTLDLSGLAPPRVARWFNPLTGAVSPAEEGQTSESWWRLRRPEGWQDAVLTVTGAGR